MTVLVNDLLTLNHSEDNKIKFNFKKINILEIIEQTIFEFSGETRKKDLEVIFIKPDTNIPQIDGDEEMIRVVIQNLLENSIKYSFKDHKIFIALKYNDKNKEIDISIRDNGIGIKESDKENIFNKFFRAENATEKDPLGSGLGLFTTKNIIERHGGKIWFESLPASGTTFS
jgi:signal transduction histidine kinase